MPHPTMVCPACRLRTSAVIHPDCPACDGVGVIPLGRPALHQAPPEAIARAVTLILEDTARQALHHPQPARPGLIAAAIQELRAAGLTHHGPTTGTPARNTPPPATPTHTKTIAEQLTISLGHDPHPGLADAPHEDVATARRERHLPAHLSASGHPSALAQTTDPITDLGPDTTHYANQHAAWNHQARVLTQAAPIAAAQRTRRTTP